MPRSFILAASVSCAVAAAGLCAEARADGSQASATATVRTADGRTMTRTVVCGPDGAATGGRQTQRQAGAPGQTPGGQADGAAANRAAGPASSSSGVFAMATADGGRVQTSVGCR